MPTGDTPPPGWQPQYGQYGQPQYGQPQYGQPQYGQPQYGYGGGPGSPGPGGPHGSRAAVLWLVSGGLVVVAAIVIVVVALTSGGGSSSTPAADGTTSVIPTSSRGTSPSSSSGLPSTGSAGTSASTGGGTAPTTDKLPRNAGSSSCGTDGYSDLVAVSVVTVVGLATKGQKADSYISAVLRDCTSASVRSTISALYGTQFDYEVGNDLTGHDGIGATAEYRVTEKTGTGTLTLTLTRQQDGHYEVTHYTFER